MFLCLLCIHITYLGAVKIIFALVRINLGAVNCIQTITRTQEHSLRINPGAVISYTKINTRE